MSAVCQFNEHTGGCHWIGCQNPDPGSPTGCPLPWPTASVSLPSEQLLRETAAALAHRACCGTEHDPPNGKLHGFCVVCGVPWPCETAKYYLRRADKANDVAEVIGSKESAWHAVWGKLKAHNPKFFELDYNGLGCVIKEIERLQALDEPAGAQS